MPPAHLVSVGEIARMCAAHIQTLAPQLLPNGKKSGQEWICGSPAGEPGTQMAVHLTGTKAGIWAHFAGHERGDALDLIAVVLFAGDKREALRWARRWLGIDAGDAAVLATARRALPDQAKLAAAAAVDEAKSRTAAKTIWLAAQAGLANTPVADYLARRGIDLAEMARPPRAIRYHPRLWHTESQRHWPAMVTAISGPDGFLAIHRTWLQVGDNALPRSQDNRLAIVTKAPVEPQKAVWGAYRGGHIPLQRGATGKPLRQAEDGETLDITEGIEDGLTVAVFNPTFRVIAAVSLSALAVIELPPAIRTLRIWRQADTKKPALEAFDRAVAAHQAAGRAILIPALEPGAKDVNEMIAGLS